MWPPRRGEQPDPTSPDLSAWLTAYVDGELDAGTRARVEAWLAGNPRARAAVEAQRRLKEWVDQAAPPEPDRRAWERTFARVEGALAGRAAIAPDGSSPVWRGRARAWLVAAGGLAVAASVLLAVFVSRPRPDGPPRDEPADEVFAVAGPGDVVIDNMDPADAGALIVGLPPPERSEPGPWEVATDEEVTIITMDVTDAAALVVGEFPMVGPLVLVSPGDVRLDHVAPHPADDMRPVLYQPAGGSPMLAIPPRPGKD